VDTDLAFPLFMKTGVQVFRLMRSSLPRRFPACLLFRLLVSFGLSDGGLLLQHIPLAPVPFSLLPFSPLFRLVVLPRCARAAAVFWSSPFLLVFSSVFFNVNGFFGFFFLSVPPLFLVVGVWPSSAFLPFEEEGRQFPM